MLLSEFNQSMFQRIPFVVGPGSVPSRCSMVDAQLTVWCSKEASQVDNVTTESASAPSNSIILPIITH